ncbi:MAG TPA: F0F1 ATP synthase subunit A [Thermoanaerobaculia bacterium]|jgi:F-type H+-transporting ATPase subunit a|nr:F0F1 ATP synthase subunit A [Thermoanaerobaculia bacterium]
MLAFLMAANPLEHVVQHPIIQRPANWGALTPEGKISVLTNQTAMMIVAGLLLVLFVPALVKRRRGTGEVDRLVPTGSANFFEAVCEYLRKEIAQPNLHEHTDRFIKYIWSVFFFILTCNVLGLLPVAAVSSLFGLHLGGTPTGNVWVTAALAICTLVMMVFNGIRLGGRHYFAHFCPGPLWLAPVLVPVEIVGVIAKIFALTVRLFANMLAGHILLAVLLGFILSAGASMGYAGGFGIAIPAVLGSVAITLLEIFVAFLQAFIFTFLTTLFIGQSVVFHHGGPGELHHEGAH